MKQLLILSGKGGTGKTTVASAFIRLSDARTYADCDVEAPNLHLITGWSSEPVRTDFYGLSKAEIDADLCIECGLCKEHCRFKAIRVEETYTVDPFACEGCASVIMSARSRRSPWRRLFRGSCSSIRRVTGFFRPRSSKWAAACRACW